MPTASDVSVWIAFGEMEVFEPNYLLPNWDVFVDEAKIEKMKDTVKFENICMFGRVLWGFWIDSKKN
ncbi:hypothetical protein BpHYR1_025586 [Brachionus plicatilis]|uniref:Uncharacterized protein n=1 Tax=Brachionus plicatilis TaxID=10195 RepID=A0A3M7S568_BRAPC|nr:hypothetical protein BpHYR1_025586 [Brachionus plicatilis]